MISLFGTIAILFALFFSLLQIILPVWGYRRNNSFLLAFARPAAYGQAFYVLIAYGLLTLAFVNNDFTLTYVAANSHTTLPLIYKLTAPFGSHEGSILLWILLLNVWSVAFSFVSTLDKELRSLTLAMLGLISLCFLSFLLFTSNPFLTAFEPQISRDLNPLLQDPGFVIHPPMLYMGYVGFSVAFAMTEAALLQNKLDQAWAKITRRFAVAAWCFLTLGIALGSWWAYRVLGWGGFWFWDPVENASLLPWLAGVGLIHVLLLVEKYNTTKNWAILLAMFTFILSLLGTFLVRSGVLVSVHTFANDPSRGIFLLILLAILMIITLGIYVSRLSSSSVKDCFTTIPFFSREMFLIWNSGLLFIAMLTILLGTLYPLILDALHLGSISVGAPYFNLVLLPQVLLLMIMMSLAATSQWQSTRLPWLTILKNLAISFIVASAFLWLIADQINWLTALCLSLSIWIILNTGSSLRRAPSMSIAHIGFAILIMGILLSSFLKEEREVRVQTGHVITLGSYDFYFLSTQSTSGSNYRGIQATFEVKKNNHHVAYLHPEKRIYPVRDMVITKVAIHPSIFRDIYLVLGEPFTKEDWSIRLYYKPFIRWIWLGAIMMAIGGLLSFNKRLI